MKLKYYLRGAGVGLIVATLILTIAYSISQPTMSDEEIKKAAAKLGMVEAEESTSTIEEAKEQEETKTVEESTTEETAGEEATETVSFTINAGESSGVVCNRLQELGLVDSGESFDKFLSEQGFDNNLLPGDFTIPKGSNFLQIAEILTRKDQ